MFLKRGCSLPIPTFFSLTYSDLEQRPIKSLESIQGIPSFSCKEKELRSGKDPRILPAKLKDVRRGLEISKRLREQWVGQDILNHPLLMHCWGK
jgi:hypothetical protein